MAVLTYTKSGNKATTAARLDKSVFGLEVKNHDLLKQAYLTYLANGRINAAITKKRGEVRGGGRKPWRQKGTGRARFGSSRNPIWRGGGVTFGPTGQESYSRKLNVKAKRQAIRQALSMASDANKIIVVEDFATGSGKTKDVIKFLNKIGTNGSILCVISQKTVEQNRATQNISGLKICTAKYLNVFDVLNADHIVISQKSLSIINEWLGDPSTTVGVKKEQSSTAKANKDKK